MANRVIARKFRTETGFVFLISDDFAKTYLEYCDVPNMAEVWADLFEEDGFEDLASDVEFDVDSELPLLDENSVPVSELCFILEDFT